jgi:hypothetical protein
VPDSLDSLDSQMAAPDLVRGRLVDHRRRVVEIDGQPALARDLRAQRGQRAVRQDLAAGGDDHPRAQRLDVVHVVGRQDHRDAVLA